MSRLSGTATVRPVEGRIAATVTGEALVNHQKEPTPRGDSADCAPLWDSPLPASALTTTHSGHRWLWVHRVPALLTLSHLSEEGPASELGRTGDTGRQRREGTGPGVTLNFPWRAVGQQNVLRRWRRSVSALPNAAAPGQVATEHVTCGWWGGGLGPMRSPASQDGCAGESWGPPGAGLGHRKGLPPASCQCRGGRGPRGHDPELWVRDAVCRALTAPRFCTRVPPTVPGAAAVLLTSAPLLVTEDSALEQMCRWWGLHGDAMSANAA